MKYTLLYILSVIFVNWAFDILPRLALSGGDVWSPASLIVGFIFVIRDYAQREIGHLILPAMLFGALLSALFSTPEIAFAAAVAFLASETTDWAVYTLTGLPFARRILLSSLISTPVDSLVFLGMIGMLSPFSVLLMSASKMFGAVFVFYSISKSRP
ncbi:MAG: hypothetical protein LBS65_00625 [Desulfovibrio sp.]|jgi:uncharacterized PurR-regulated membrane protein YhhQ (DUF165 family)|nr:hypothetical protein [Desulfovibrio sp.]